MTIKHEALDSCSIDRIDNSIGYHDGNIQLVCLWANTARSSAGVPELLGVLREAGMRSI